ncbi:MAG TPA: DoxX family protein [Halalkalibaculum sp.]|nr:DoxX family protein [Halalkalibaculum sp.]
MRRRNPGTYRNIGFLILRIGLGIIMMLHGYPKLFGGPEMWAELGTATQSLGIDFAPIFFGFIASVTEFFGGLFLLLGLFFRPTLVFMVIVMIVAAASHIAAGDGFTDTSHSIELAIVFVSMLLIGPGEYSLDRKLNARKQRRY